MSNGKDLGSDAARSDPETADQDREALKRRAEENIDRSKGKKKDTDPDDHDEKRDNPTPGSEAAEPSPE